MNQLFINVIEISLVFTIIIVLLFLIMHMIGKKFTAKCRYILWTIIFIRLIVPLGSFSGVALFTFELPVTQSLIAQNTVFSSSSSGDNTATNVNDSQNPNTNNAIDTSNKVNEQLNQQSIVKSDAGNESSLSNDSALSLLTNASQSMGFFEIYGTFIFSILALIWLIVAILYFFGISQFTFCLH